MMAGGVLVMVLYALWELTELPYLPTVLKMLVALTVLPYLLTSLQTPSVATGLAVATPRYVPSSAQSSGVPHPVGRKILAGGGGGAMQ
jgi:hypothetical protein